MAVRECEQLFSMAVQQKLKRKIIAKIFVKVTRNDELLVVINRQDNDDELEFKLFISNFSEKCLNGLTSDFVVYEVMRGYKQFLIGMMEEKYFYQD